MSRERRAVSYGRSVIEFDVLRRDRKTLEIAVEPDLSVVIAAPRHARPDAIDAKVKKRAAWIRRQQAYFWQFLPRATERRYVSGETHLYLGRQYRLKVRRDLADKVVLYRGFIHVRTTKPKDETHVRQLVQDWYRERAKLKLEERLSTCIEYFSVAAAHTPAALIIRKLERRWGSLSAANRLVLNLRLIQAPVDCIDYVITHELCHMKVRNHGAAFLELLTATMPDWERRKSKLEQILA